MQPDKGFQWYMDAGFACTFNKDHFDVDPAVVKSQSEVYIFNEGCLAPWASKLQTMFHVHFNL